MKNIFLQSGFSRLKNTRNELNGKDVKLSYMPISIKFTLVWKILTKHQTRIEYITFIYYINRATAINKIDDDWGGSICDWHKCVHARMTSYERVSERKKKISSAVNLPICASIHNTDLKFYNIRIHSFQSYRHPFAFCVVIVFFAHFSYLLYNQLPWCIVFFCLWMRYGKR